MSADCLLILFTVVATIYSHPLLPDATSKKQEDNPRWLNAWVVQLLLNLLGYASVLVPGYIVIQLIKRSSYLKHPDDGCVRRSVRLFVQGLSSSELLAVKSPSLFSGIGEKTLLKQCASLTFCSVGLLSSYLIWGLLQERIMATKYNQADGSEENFRNSLFLEFMNRILAVFIAIIILFFQNSPTHKAPVYVYCYNAFSNVMSSWFQYEALKYVSFPVQVLAKACKVIPVMLMSRVIMKKTYTVLEYMTGFMISIGLFMFLVNSEDTVRVKGHEATVSGIILMSGYLLFDTFTVNWQGKLYQTYQMTSIQMMAGSNLFAIVFASVSLLEQGGFAEAYAFMSRHPSFIFHISILAAASSVGQLFIYYTIHEFGPVTFTIIMTVRQAISILLSCIFFRHPVHFVGLVGVVICFGAIFVRIYYTGYKRSHSATSPPAK